MGRRSTHSPQQLRELILDAAQEIIDVHGLAGLSAREIARRIGYSPGTIYNMFDNLDDVVLHVEQALAPHFPAGKEAELQRASRVLWAGVHGITSLSTADKLSVVTTETAGRLIDDLVGTYLAGLPSRDRSV